MATFASTIINGTPTANQSVLSLKPMSDGFQAMVTAGTLGQAADTGQVSWGGVSASQVSTANYEIFYINDSQHSTNPIYFKVVYQTNATGSTTSCTLQIGTGTNGSGALTGMVSSAQNIRGSSGQADTTSYPIWCSAGSGYVNFWGGCPNTTGASCCGAYAVSVERLRNSSGAITGDGITVNMITIMSAANTSEYLIGSAGLAASSFNEYFYSPFFNGNFSCQRYNIPSLFNNTNCVWPPVMNSGNWYYQNPMFDGTNYLALAIQPFAGKLYSPGVAFALAPPNFPPLSTVSLSSYSTGHTYLTSQASMGSTGVILSPTGPAANQHTWLYGITLPAFLYE